MRRLHVAAIACLLASCAVETTSFRTTDQSEATDKSPSAAVYDVRVGGGVGPMVHVWSHGGYIGTSDEPMTHVGFEVKNPSATPVVFDGDALSLVVFDDAGTMLPPPAFTAITPLGPSQIAVAPGATVAFDGYFKLPVRPKVVDRMRLRWALRFGDERYTQTTNFVRE